MDRVWRRRRCISNMIEHEAVNHGSLAGIWHCACGGETFTKYTIAKLMGEVMGVSTTHLSSDPSPPTVSSDHGPAPQPLDP